MSKVKSNLTVSGNVTITGTPTNANHAATKDYVDTAVPPSSIPNGGTTGQILEKTSNADQDIQWATLEKHVLLEYGGVVPPTTPVGTIVFEKAPATVSWDFRNLSALPSGWARRGVASETFDANGMTATYAQGQGHFVSAIAGSGSAATAILKVYSQSGYSTTMFGPIFHNGSTGIQTAWYNGPTGCLALTVNGSFGYGNTFTSISVTPSFPSWLKLRKAGSLYYASYSLDGVSFSAETASLSGPADSTTLTIGSILGSVTTTVESISLTGGISGGLRGWWNGSAVVPF